jgi:hypothetical protein
MSHDKALKEKVFEWLNSQGYPLEMRVASMLRNSGFRVQHSARYTDPETSKSREIDVIATPIADPYGIVDIHFVIECKATSKPWIIFSAEYAREGLNALRTFAITSERAEEFITDHAEALYTTLAWVIKKGRVGFSLAQAFSDGHDVTYEAILSAVKASASLYRDNESQGVSKIPFFFAIPVIVTASPLFECYLDNKGNMKVQEIEEGVVFFDAKIDDISGIYVRVISENALESLQKTISDMSKSMAALLKEDVEQEWIIWQERVNSVPQKNGAYRLTSVSREEGEID